MGELHLRGFVFDELTVPKFSKIIVELQVDNLTLDQCDLNDEMVSLLKVPSCLKSIHLKYLNLSSKGIQGILEKLPVTLEAIELSECFINEPEVQKVPLILSKIPSLKHISIDASTVGKFNIYSVLSFLKTLALESIKLKGFELDCE